MPCSKTMAEPFALMALVLDAAIGWPGALYRRVGHPVGLFARIINACEGAWNRPTHSDGIRKTLGVMTVLILLVLTIGAGLMLVAWCRSTGLARSGPTQPLRSCSSHRSRTGAE